MSALPRTADIVIIGAGAIGSSIAYQLSKRGARDVVVVEREAIGQGFQHSFAVGEMVTELLTTGSTSLDIRDLRLRCF